HSLWIGFAFLLIGFPVYFLLEMYYDERVIRKVNDALAIFARLTEKVFFPVKVRKTMISLLGNVKNKHVLEYGCNVGTLTLYLAKAVGPKGKVFATDESEHALKILEKRVNKKGHKHVRILLDQPNKVHPKIPHIDAVVSAGMIGYLQKEKKVLKELNKRLRKGSKIVFLDYDKFFEVIPNIEWLSDDKCIKDVFKSSGFKVAIIRRNGLAWQYIYIYGFKVKNVK
ncbi:class I SAM-dependent methyltransferase, partial [Candidatus Woesearchaeota archaeon]|nr:class I SAM-dependent methyltransferase [Candidatus Woesearchaeota archaeon]